MRIPTAQGCKYVREPGNNAAICRLLAYASVLLGLLSPIAQAASGRLMATGGVSELEGSAGGGLTPWALIAGLGTDTQAGGAAFCTRVSPQDFRLDACGVALGVADRAEFSFARESLDLGSTVPGQSIRLDVFGAKLRVAGDAVYDQDRWLPQLAIGLQYKRNRDFDLVPALLGARSAQGEDWYLAATKLWLDGIFGRFTLVDLTLRSTNANQLGLLGFGGDRKAGRSMEIEGSAAIFLTDRTALGVEYRQKPDNLRVFHEEDFADLFVALFAGKHLSLTLAWTELGTIADKRNQRGLYLSLQAGL